MVNLKKKTTDEAVLSVYNKPYVFLHIDFENTSISALFCLYISYKLECSQTARQSSFSVGGSSAHSFIFVSHLKHLSQKWEI